MESRSSLLALTPLVSRRFQSFAEAADAALGAVVGTVEGTVVLGQAEDDGEAWRLLDVRGANAACASDEIQLQGGNNHAMWRIALAGTAALVLAGFCGPASALAGGPKVKVSAAATAGTSLDVVVTATTKKGKRDKKFKGSIAVSSDDSQGIAPAAHKFKGKDKGRFTFTGLELRTAGVRTVTARAGKKSTSKSVTVAPGPVVQLSISPPGDTISLPAPSGVQADFSALLPGPVSTSQAYSASGADEFGNPLGDLTPSTTWSIGPDGSCTGSVCSPSLPGAHTVTALVGSASGNVPMSVPTLAATYGITCQGENYDLDQGLGNGCEVAEPDPGQGTAASAQFLGSTDECDENGRTFDGALLSDSRAHTNPTVGGFNSAVGGPPEFYRVDFNDASNFCVEEYALQVVASGGAAVPSDCYRVTLSWVYDGGSNPPGSDSALFSGIDSAVLSGTFDSGLITGDDSANFLVNLEPICSPPRNEQVNFQVQLHF